MAHLVKRNRILLGGNWYSGVEITTRIGFYIGIFACLGYVAAHLIKKFW